MKYSLFISLIFLSGCSRSYNESFKLQDGTIVNNCSGRYANCGLHIYCENGSEYYCQQNVQILK